MRTKCHQSQLQQFPVTSYAHNRITKTIPLKNKNKNKIYAIHVSLHLCNVTRLIVCTDHAASCSTDPNTFLSTLAMTGLMSCQTNLHLNRHSVSGRTAARTELMMCLPPHLPPTETVVAMTGLTSCPIDWHPNRHSLSGRTAARIELMMFLPPHLPPIETAVATERPW